MLGAARAVASAAARLFSVDDQGFQFPGGETWQAIDTGLVVPYEVAVKRRVGALAQIVL